MASPLRIKPFLILGLLAVFLLLSFAGAHYTHDDDTEPIPKKSDHHKGGYDKPIYDKGDADKPEKDDDDDDDDDGGKYEHGAGYEKSEHDDNDDDDDDDDEPRNDDKGHAHGGYDEPKEGPSGDHKQPKPASYTPMVVVPKSISVEGVASCQDCKYAGGDSLSNAKPIAGAKVKLICQTGPRYKSFLYATATTDANGFFLISVPHFDFKKFTPVDNCAVFLVSSPLKECSMATDINMGKTGGRLRPIPTFAPSENLMYSVGPFAFAPKQCSPKPPTGYIPPPASVPMPKPGQSPPPAYGSGSHY